MAAATAAVAAVVEDGGSASGGGDQSADTYGDVGIPTPDSVRKRNLDAENCSATCSVEPIEDPVLIRRRGSEDACAAATDSLEAAAGSPTAKLPSGDAPL